MDDLARDLRRTLFQQIPALATLTGEERRRAEYLIDREAEEAIAAALEDAANQPWG